MVPHICPVLADVGEMLQAEDLSNHFRESGDQSARDLLCSIYRDFFRSLPSRVAAPAFAA
jgi:hypothetical protein